MAFSPGVTRYIGRLGQAGLVRSQYSTVGSRGQRSLSTLQGRGMRGLMDVRSRPMAFMSAYGGVFDVKADMQRRTVSSMVVGLRSSGSESSSGVSSRSQGDAIRNTAVKSEWSRSRKSITPLHSRSFLGLESRIPWHTPTGLTKQYSTSSRRRSSPSTQKSKFPPPVTTTTPSPTTSTSTPTPTPTPTATTTTTTTTIPPPLPHPSETREYIWTLPNILTISRLTITPLIGYTILTSQPYLALTLFLYAGLTDLIDGHIARHYNQTTVLGTVLDPMADKFLMTTVVLCTTVRGLLPPWLAAIILGRDAALALSALYFRYISLPPPKTLARFWDFGLPSAEVRPTAISKINTLLQLLLVGAAMVAPVIPDAVVDAWNLRGVFEGWTYLVAATTLWSGASYVFTKDAVKILRR